MKRFLIALSLLAIAGCSSGEDEEATPTPSADGDSPPTSRRPPSAPTGPGMGAPGMGAPGMGGPGSAGGGQSAVALPPIAAANKAPEPPSATGSSNPAPPVNFDTQKFIDQGASPKTVRSAKPGMEVTSSSSGTPGSAPSMQQMRPPGIPSTGMAPMASPMRPPMPAGSTRP